LLGVDGPYAWELLKSFLGLGIIGTRYLEVVPRQRIGGIDVTLCRAGKTGEYGYMLLAGADDVTTLWDALKAAGQRFELLPVGYRTADLCKMENRNISAHREGTAIGNVLELNTRTMLSRDKAAFVASDAVQAVIATGVARRIVGVTFPESVPPEQPDMTAGAPVRFAGRTIGSLANVDYSFALRRWIGLALLDAAFACVGVSYEVSTAAGPHAVQTVSAPFLFNRSLTIRPQEDSYFV
jgi:glycine cleavage system aminomethyltransferase T